MLSSVFNYGDIVILIHIKKPPAVTGGLQKKNN